jgi:hypothetical protein
MPHSGVNGQVMRWKTQSQLGRKTEEGKMGREREGGGK